VSKKTVIPKIKNNKYLTTGKAVNFIF